MPFNLLSLVPEWMKKYAQLNHGQVSQLYVISSERAEAFKQAFSNAAAGAGGEVGRVYHEITTTMTCLNSMQSKVVQDPKGTLDLMPGSSQFVRQLKALCGKIGDAAHYHGLDSDKRITPTADSKQLSMDDALLIMRMIGHYNGTLGAILKKVCEGQRHGEANFLNHLPDSMPGVSNLPDVARREITALIQRLQFPWVEVFQVFNMPDEIFRGVVVEKDDLQRVVDILEDELLAFPTFENAALQGRGQAFLEAKEQCIGALQCACDKGFLDLSGDGDFVQAVLALRAALLEGLDITTLSAADQSACYTRLKIFSSILASFSENMDYKAFFLKGLQQLGLHDIKVDQSSEDPREVFIARERKGALERLGSRGVFDSIFPSTAGAPVQETERDFLKAMQEGNAKLRAEIETLPAPTLKDLAKALQDFQAAQSGLGILIDGRVPCPMSRPTQPNAEEAPTAHLLRLLSENPWLDAIDQGFWDGLNTVGEAPAKLEILNQLNEVFYQAQASIRRDADALKSVKDAYQPYKDQFSSHQSLRALTLNNLTELLRLLPANNRDAWHGAFKKQKDSWFNVLKCRLARLLGYEALDLHALGQAILVAQQPSTEPSQALTHEALLSKMVRAGQLSEVLLGQNFNGIINEIIQKVEVLQGQRSNSPESGHSAWSRFTGFDWIFSRDALDGQFSNSDVSPIFSTLFGRW